MSEWWRRTRDLLVQTGKDALVDNTPEWAAAIAFYGLLSLFPLLVAVVSLTAHFVEPEWAIQTATGFVGDYLPRGREFVRTTVEEAIQARGPAGLFSTLLLLWSGSRVFGTLTKALNIVYDVDAPYGLGKRLLLELAMTLTFGVLFVLSVSSGLLLDLLRNSIPFLPRQRDFLFQAIRWSLPTLLLFLTFFLVYRFVPRGRRHTQAALVGAGAATLIFLLARALFVFYLQQFGRYNLVYGSLAVVIVVLLWTWITALIVLVGGELASHYQMMGIEGRDAEEVRRRHAARAPERKE